MAGAVAQPRARGYRTLARLLPSRGEATGGLLLSLPLLVTFATLDSARWVTTLPSFLYEVALALVVGYYLARSIRSRRASLTLGLLVGLGSAIGQGVRFLGGTDIQTMGTILLAVTWWATFITVWLAYRRHSPPLVLAPSLLVLLIALGFLPSRYTLTIGLYLVASAPVLAHLHLQRWVVTAPIRTPRLSTLVLGVSVMAVIVVGAWLTPTHDEGIRPAVVKRLEDPLFDLLERASGLLASVPNRKDWPTFDLGSGLPFTGPTALTDDVVMTVRSRAPHKWRLRVYETYTPQGWSRPLEEEEAYRYRFTDILDPPATLGQYVRAPIEVRTFTAMDVMASAGEPLAAGDEGKLELSPIPQFTLNLMGPQDSYLPQSVEAMRQGIITDQQGLGQGEELADAVLPRLYEEGLNATSNLADLEEELTVERSRGPSTALAIQFGERRSPPRSYQTVGIVSTAPVSDLRQLTGEVPRWVADRYLQLPPNFPAEVRGLASDIAQDLQSPYDIAVAIQNYLRGLPYQREIVPPPPEVDGVYWFLTVQQVGFCQYYASAMITMLRSLGIPARLVTGFAPGEWDPERDAWVVRNRHYHAWPEVYLPGHGWVEFEPTPADVQPSLQLVGSAFEPRLDDLLDDLSAAAPCVGEDFDPFGLCDEAAIQAALEELTSNTPEATTDDESAGGIAIFNIPVRTGLYWLVGAVGLALVVVVGMSLVIRRPIPSRRRRDYAGRVFFRMSLLGRLAGVPRSPSDTPDEYRMRLVRLIPGHAGTVSQIAEVYRLSRYSRSKLLDDAQVERLRLLWPPVRRALLWQSLRRLRPRLPFGGRRLQLAPRAP